MVVNTLEQRWESGPAIDLQKMPILAKKKNHFFRWSSVWSWRLCKQVKLPNLGHRKPARMNWKANAPKTSHFLVRILVQRHNWAIFLRKKSKERPLQLMAIVIRPCWMTFCLQKLKRRILATFGFKRAALRATQPKLRTMFCALFLQDRIISRRADGV